MKNLSFVLGASILNALENKFTVLENQLMSIENKNSQKMVTLNKKLDHLTASSIIVRFILLIFMKYFF
jgi:mannose/fructose/N-acetylgalactosamine-specific phosphotransferase system component IID